MKVLGNLSIVKKDDANIPFGASIQNETTTQEGTPVVDDVIQDVLSNLYRLLELAKITPTNAFDNDLTQYQIVEALKKLPNSLNDIEQVLSLDDTVWSVPFDLSILPNKYFFIGRASEGYVSGRPYTFKGTGTTEYSFSSPGFNSSDEVIVVIDSSSVRAYSITPLTSNGDVFTSLGSPLAFNDGNVMRYQDEGKLLSDVPSIVDLEVVLRSEYDDSSLIINDMFYIGGFILCFCFIPAGNLYFFRQFQIDDLSSSDLVNIVGVSFGNSDNFLPNVYVSGSSPYVTNSMNNLVDDFKIVKLDYDPSEPNLTYVSAIELDDTFVKTTNAVIKTGNLYTIVSGALNRFNLTTGVKTLMGNYTGVVGQLFWFNGYPYFTSGEVAKRWF